MGRFCLIGSSAEGEVRVFRTGEVDNDFSAGYKILEPIVTMPPLHADETMHSAVGVFPFVYLIGRGANLSLEEGENVWRELPPPLCVRDFPLLLSLDDLCTLPYGSVVILPPTYPQLYPPHFGEIFNPLKQEPPYSFPIPAPPTRLSSSPIALAVTAANQLFVAFEQDETQLFCYSFSKHRWSNTSIDPPDGRWGRGQSSIFHQDRLYSFSDGHLYLYNLPGDGNPEYGEHIYRGSVENFAQFLIDSDDYGDDPAILFADSGSLYLVWSYECPGGLQVRVLRFIVEPRFEDGRMWSTIVTDSDHVLRFCLKGAIGRLQVALLLEED